MYEWRKMTGEERAEILVERKGRRLPWHSPPHLEFAGLVTFIITAACCEHKNIISKNFERMAQFENEILNVCQTIDARNFRLVRFAESLSFTRPHRKYQTIEKGNWQTSRANGAFLESGGRRAKQASLVQFF